MIGITSMAAPSGTSDACSTRLLIARRILDDTQQMLIVALQHPEQTELAAVLERTLAEAERVVKDTERLA